MTDDELRKLAEAALEQDRAATPGSWHEESLWAGLRHLRKVAEWYPDEDMPPGMDVPWEHDASFIAAARDREPELARAVLRLLEERDTLLRPSPGTKSRTDLGTARAALLWTKGELRRATAERDELARYKAAVEAMIAEWSICPDVQVRDAAHDARAAIAMRLESP